MMQRFWSWLAVNLGKRAGLVVGDRPRSSPRCSASAITQLEFATGQDSYLNKSDQVYKDNVAYQDLFGGQAMLTRHHDGRGPHGRRAVHARTNRAQLQTVRTTSSLEQRRPCIGVITPLDDRCEFADILVQSDRGDPTASIAGRALLRPLERRSSPDRRSRPRASGRRGTTLAAHRTRSRPTQRTFDNPEWVKFLLYDNQGDIRKRAAAVLPRQDARADRHAPPRQRSRSRRRARRPTSCRRRPTSSTSRTRPIVTDRRAGAAQGHQRLPHGRDAHPRRHRRRDHDRDPARAVQRALAAVAARA